MSHFPSCMRQVAYAEPIDVCIYIYILHTVYTHTHTLNAWALPQRCSVEGSHSQMLLQLYIPLGRSTKAFSLEPNKSFSKRVPGATRMGIDSTIRWWSGDYCKCIFVRACWRDCSRFVWCVFLKVFSWSLPSKGFLHVHEANLTTIPEDQGENWEIYGNAELYVVDGKWNIAMEIFTVRKCIYYYLNWTHKETSMIMGIHSYDIIGNDNMHL